MSIGQYRAFVVAAETGSFTAAAIDLGITQPSVSELVRRLESEYQVQLFVRGPRRLTLTAAGEELLPHAQQIVAGAEAAERTLSDIQSLEGGVATFGLLRNGDYYLLSSLIERFHAEYPNVRVRLVGLNSVEVAAAVSTGELEAGLVVLPIDDEDLVVTPLFRDEVFYASADPERLRKPKTIAEFCAAPLVLYDAHYGWRDPTRRQLAARAQLEGLRVEARIEVEHIEAALGLVSRGAGDTIVCRAIAESSTMPEGVGVVPFEEPLYDTIAMIRGRSAGLSPATRELMRFARDMIPGPLPQG